MYCMVFGEARHEIILVLPNTPNQVRGYTRVESAVSLACQQINTWLLQSDVGRAGPQPPLGRRPKLRTRPQILRDPR